MAVEAAREATSHLVGIAPNDPRSLLGSSAPYLRLLGTTVCAGLLARAALAVVAGAGYDDAFRSAKLTNAKFFGEQILPTVHGLLPAVLASADDLFALSPEQLA
jgi:acyl-CoA dehydrogenase